MKLKDMFSVNATREFEQVDLQVISIVNKIKKISNECYHHRILNPADFKQINNLCDDVTELLMFSKSELH